MSSRDFLEALAYMRRQRKLELDKEFYSTSKIEHYLAKIAYEVFRTNKAIPVEKRNALTEESFLVLFKRPKKRPKGMTRKQMKIEETRNKMRMAKLFNSVAMGLDPTEMLNAEEQGMPSEGS